MHENRNRRKLQLKFSVHLKTACPNPLRYVAAHKLLQIDITVMYYKIILMDSHETWAPTVGGGGKSGRSPPSHEYNTIEDHCVHSTTVI